MLSRLYYVMPLLHNNTSSKARLPIESSDMVGIMGKKMKLTKAEKRKVVSGPAQLGPYIDDLFSHSYSPPPSRTAKLFSSSWVWVATARVWDPSVERFPASVSDIRKFGAQAKYLRRVHPSTTDGRWFVEVTMEKRQLQSREARDGD